jgi:hypothetical protein
MAFIFSQLAPFILLVILLGLLLSREDERDLFCRNVRLLLKYTDYNQKTIAYMSGVSYLQYFLEMVC